MYGDLWGGVSGKVPKNPHRCSSLKPFGAPQCCEMSFFFWGGREQAESETP